MSERSKTRAIFRDLIELANEAIMQLRRRRSPRAKLLGMRVLCRRAPLPAGEMLLVSQRISSAESAASVGEFAAARFELRMLCGIFEMQLTQEPPHSIASSFADYRRIEPSELPARFEPLLKPVV